MIELDKEKLLSLAHMCYLDNDKMQDLTNTIVCCWSFDPRAKERDYNLGSLIAVVDHFRFLYKKIWERYYHLNGEEAQNAYVESLWAMAKRARKEQEQ